MVYQILMNPLIIIGGLAVTITGAFLLTQNAEGKMTITLTPERKKLPFESEFRQVAEKFAVDWRLLAAHASVESSFKSDAVNLEKPGVEDGSYGLMQIYVVWDSENLYPANKLNYPGWGKMTRTQLFDPVTNISVGSTIIRENLMRYGMPRAIAVYNRYAERASPQYGPFKNQSYVNKVLAKYEQFKAEFPE